MGVGLLIRRRVAGLTNDDRARAMPDTTTEKTVNGGRPRYESRKSLGEPHIGKALRSVYDQTVRETVPQEMLDLLGRLD